MTSTPKSVPKSATNSALIAAVGTRRGELTAALAQLESALHQVDAIDDQIGMHAGHARGKLTAELARRADGLAAADERGQAEYLHLAKQRQHADRIAGVAAAARARR